MGDHAYFSPSSMSRKAACPASARVEADYPDSSNAAADDGTHTHSLIEASLVEGKGVHTYLGKTLTDHAGVFEVTQDRVDRAKVMLDYCYRLMQVGYTVYPEVRVSPGDAYDTDNYYGTADVIAVRGDEMYVIDYKDGSGPVVVDDNLQLMSYAIGALVMFPTVDIVNMVIVQPKVYGNMPQIWTQSAAYIRSKWIPLIGDILVACQSEDAEYRPSEGACRYCKHKTNCEARSAFAREAINTAMADVSLPQDSPLPLPEKLPDINAMSPEQLAKILMMAPVLKGWLSEVEKHSLSKAVGGTRIPGFKVIQKKGKRSWVDDHDAVIKKLTAMTHNKKRVFKKADVTTESLIPFTKILANPDLTKVQRETIETELLKSPAGHRSLVPMATDGKDISPQGQLDDLGVKIEMQQP